MSITKDLVSALSEWPFIGGFRDTSEELTRCLHDVIFNDIGEQWGSLVSFCIRQSSQAPYDLVFQLAIKAFGRNSDMAVLSQLAAFGCVDEIKELILPQYSSFAAFRLHEFPKATVLSRIISTDHSTDIIQLNQAVKRPFRFRNEGYIDRESEIERLAAFLSKQWPETTPSGAGFRGRLINVQKAVKIILPE